MRLIVMVGGVCAERFCRVTPRASVGDGGVGRMVKYAVHGGAFQSFGGAADNWRMPEARDRVNPIRRCRPYWARCASGSFARIGAYLDAATGSNSAARAHDKGSPLVVAGEPSVVRVSVATSAGRGSPSTLA